MFHPERDQNLPDEVEHIYPDYSLYPEYVDTAFGFLTRGCPRRCSFCHVKDKEGITARKVADLDEFWNGQKNIVLCDPNIIACPEWKPLLEQLIDSNAWIDINQGMDMRMMTEEKANMVKQLKVKNIHFAWDRYEDKDMIAKKFRMFKDITGWDYRKLTVFVLTNYDTTFEQDLERVYMLREIGYQPYVMVYNRQNTTMKDRCRQLQRWCNNRRLFKMCERFEDYDTSKQKKYQKRTS